MTRDIPFTIFQRSHSSKIYAPPKYACSLFSPGGLLGFLVGRRRGPHDFRCGYKAGIRIGALQHSFTCLCFLTTRWHVGFLQLQGYGLCLSVVPLPTGVHLGCFLSVKSTFMGVRHWDCGVGLVSLTSRTIDWAAAFWPRFVFSMAGML